MKRRTFLAVTGATAASVALAGCGEPAQDNGDGGGNGGGDDDVDFDAVEGETGETADNLALTSTTMVETSRGVAVMGTVENTGETAYDFVEVEVTLNDGDSTIGEVADTSDDELDGLGAGELWRFMTSFDGEEMYAATGYTVNIDGELANGGTETTSS
ncbi:hypothetical protein G9C85_08310 [Halorubellus sp. JP-L1]|uniref:FxLYD domain-containing protein n=1 Tax=Halorubellus sp. JP-L1 TaxID=2715753 RepID=UPI001409ED6D|nr:FxLYD domain-containing protein [Halorubellus sp. JP-L1]NHN41635.1 hypothetical protein [Halorubellus sp. JP-L1]